MTVSFQIEDQEFVALNGGAAFSFTPAVSFFVHCESVDDVQTLYEKLSDGGQILMPLDQYPFSKKFAWINDRFGVSWQVSLGTHSRKITPCLVFVGEQCGKAEEAIETYVSLFDHSSIDVIERYASGENEPEGTVKHATFSLHGQPFMAMDSSLNHSFTFTEATSFLINCASQEEVDALWGKLTEGGEEQPCGWLKDRFGLSWQIVPTVLLEMLSDPDREKSQRVTKAMLHMSKLEIGKLKDAYEGAMK